MLSFNKKQMKNYVGEPPDNLFCVMFLNRTFGVHMFKLSLVDGKESLLQAVMNQSEDKKLTGVMKTERVSFNKWVQEMDRQTHKVSF